VREILFHIKQRIEKNKAATKQQNVKEATKTKQN